MLFKWNLVVLIGCVCVGVESQHFLRRLLFSWITGPPPVPALRQPIPGETLDEMDRIGRNVDNLDELDNGILSNSVHDDGLPSVRFYLYPDYVNWTYREEIVPWDQQSLVNSNYNPKLPLVLIIHGFYGNDDSPARENRVLREAYLEAKFPANIVGVDWGQLVNRLNRDPTSIVSILMYYFDVVPNIPEATTHVSDFIIFLTQSGALEGPQHVQMVGFSLGAHVAGLVAQQVKKRIGRKIYRISGLDPAGPTFHSLPEDERLSSDDAEFVDVTHTNQGAYGFLAKTQMGHISWYINGGGPGQPGCSLTIQSMFIERCQHQRAFNYFADSVKGVQYSGCRCNAKQCIKDYSGQCQPFLYGQYADMRKQGTFYVEISRNPVSISSLPPTISLF